MNPRKLILFALIAAVVVFAVPWILPVGPDTQLDAAKLLGGGQFLTGALVVWLGGLLTAMTPCVYPLIPITVSVFGARKDTSRGKAVLLTSAYIVGMGVVFSILGVLAAVTGAAFGSVLGNPWVVAGLAVFLVVLAASMFGAFELALPSGLTQRLSSVGGSGYAGALLMGAASGFLAAPCTGPVLTGLLAFIAQTQSIALGASLLFVYALGIGAPFFLIGVFAIKLPKGGVWMEWVKSVLGISLLALAALYIRDAVPALRMASAALADEVGHVPGAALAAILTAFGVLLGAIHLSFKAKGSEILLKAAGVTAVVVAILLRVAALNETSSGALWARLGWVDAPAVPTELVWHHQFPAANVTAVAQFEEFLSRARAEGKPVMIDFYADWCAACKELDRETYVAPVVVTEANRFVNIKVDGTNEDDAIMELYDRFGVQGLPTVAFVDSEGKVLQDPRVTGFLKPDKFLVELQKVK